MAGLSNNTKALLNKGIGLYKIKLGDLIHDALVESENNKTADINDADEDTGWGLEIAKRAIASEATLAEVVKVLEKLTNIVAVLTEKQDALVAASLDKATDTKDLKGVLAQIVVSLGDKTNKSDMATLLNNAAVKIDGLKDAVSALATKIDADATDTGGDSNYLQAVTQILT